MGVALLGTPVAGSTAGSSTTAFTAGMPTAAQGVTDPNTLILLTAAGVATSATDIPVPTTGSWLTWQANITVSTNFKLVTYYRFASAEPASYAFSGLTTGRYAAVIRAYSGVDATNPKDVAPVPVSSTTAMVSPGAITPVTQGALIDCVNAIAQATGVTSTTWTSSNMTKDLDWFSAHATLANAAGGLAHFPWVSGAFTPNLTQASGTATRGAAITSAIRPATTLIRHRPEANRAALIRASVF